MAGTSALIAQGFGSWSTANKVPTLGLGSAAVTPPADGGNLEWLVEDTQLQWLVGNNRLEWVLKGPD